MQTKIELLFWDEILTHFQVQRKKRKQLVLVLNFKPTPTNARQMMLAYVVWYVYYVKDPVDSLKI